MPTTSVRRRRERVVAALLAVELAAATASAAGLRPGPAKVRPLDRTHASPVLGKHLDAAARTIAVRRLLAARADAVLRKDRVAFLATVDPAEHGFRARQASYIDALRDVPLASWTYRIDPDKERSHTAALDAQRGTWWSPDLTLRYAIAGFDRRPALQPQALTFVERGDRWYVAADDDFADTGHRTTRDLWDGGQVVVTRGASCLVLGHPGQARLVRKVLVDCDDAVPRVDAVWGLGWAQRVVVLVPDTTEELARIVPDAGDLSQIAAVATAELVEPSSGYRPVGDRVLINPSTFPDLGPVGRRVVITHEVTHVASRGATGREVPTWLVEGLADYVGFLGLGVPVRAATEELRAELRAGKVPGRLPTDADFDGRNKALASAYEQSWLAVSLIVKRYGRDALLRLYREVGADDGEGALARRMQSVLHTTVPAFTAAWRVDLLRRLT